MNNTLSDICPHFGTCGGCRKQDQPYDQQLAYKQTYITNLLSQFHPQQVCGIVASPQIWHFRNKMEFAVSGTIDAPVVGLRPQQKFSEVIDIRECRIFYPGVSEVLDAVRKWIVECRIEPYNFRRQTGQLRYVSMRHGKAYDEAMVVLAVALNHEQFACRQADFDRIAAQLSSINRIKSVYVCLNSGSSDEALKGELILLRGTAHIKERINAIDYRISPESFFQTNSYCCSLLYDIIRKEARGAGNAVLDLFCGCAGISLQVCPGASKVTGIDIVRRNIEDARENCRANNAANTEFMAVDAQQFLADAAASGALREYSCIIVDPPRQGLTKKDRKFITDSGIAQLIYVSCNPWNLVQDLKTLMPAYAVQKVQPVDMFPHTPHMETVVSLHRQ
jgi:23S rRNA (uracil1939-C5)-methyltransferase